jgi:hypothetical protein
VTLCLSADDHVLVLELVLEDLVNGGAERAVLVTVPDAQVLATI